MPTKLKYQTVTPLLKKVLTQLMSNDLFHPFQLVGGTSLSLQLGHRISDDIDLFTSERGWQDWMDNFSTQEVIFILNKIYEYSQESLQDIRIKLNYSRVALSRAYYIPLRTLENWDRKQNMPDYVEVLIKYTFFIKEITKNEAITE